MRGLLLDQGLPRSTTNLLVKAGYSAVHAAEIAFIAGMLLAAAGVPLAGRKILAQRLGAG